LIPLIKNYFYPKTTTFDCSKKSYRNNQIYQLMLEVFQPHSLNGTVHVIAATLGLILGLGILFLRPGSKLHVRAGYLLVPTVDKSSNEKSWTFVGF
jgi:hypothetical protein